VSCRSVPRASAAALLGVLLLAGVSAVPVGPATAAAGPHLAADYPWTVYHGNALGSGADTSGVSFSPATHAWTSPSLDGQLFGEPLEVGGRVFVATENDKVYALAANTGAVLWESNVGVPVPSSYLPCGNIGPNVGITGTPVIDPSRNEIFFVADEFSLGAPFFMHMLVALNIFTGAIQFEQPVDPLGQDPLTILQRTGANLSGGNVVFGFGGNSNDCGTYNGWVVAAPEGGGQPTYFSTTGSEGNGKGAVWMGGAAPEVDATGNIWAATGNGFSGTPYDGSDSVIELSPQLVLEQRFYPTTWQTDNLSDFDLGSTAPAFLPGQKIFQVGKSSTGYLLNQTALGLTTGGGELASAPVCSTPAGDVDGGDAVSGSVVYVGCANGVEAVQTSPSVSVLWTAASGSPGPPITAGGLVWSIQGSSLFGINPSTGATVQQLSIGGEMNHFPTPSVGDGLLLAPSSDLAANQVYAFSGSFGLPGPPSPNPNSPPPPPPPPPPPTPPKPSNSSYWTVASDGGLFSFGNAQFWGSAGSSALNRSIVGMASTRDGGGYWLVASDGGVFTYGDAGYWGSTGALALNRPIVGLAATPDGRGYWLVASDGGVFGFGEAAFHGSMGGRSLNAPIVGIASTRDAGGYWLVASDGGIFGFGDAAYHGSTGALVLNRPVVGMAATHDGLGYWLVASDGGIFTFGDASFHGSMGGTVLNRPVVGIAGTPDGGGYWMVASDGGIFSFGDARFTGSEGGAVLNRPMVGMGAAG
jgi:hypothetical protein